MTVKHQNRNKGTGCIFRREVQHRYLAKNGGTETRHTLYRDSNDVNRTIHVGAWLDDAGAAGKSGEK